MMRPLVVASCVKCGGIMRERADRGAFQRAPLGRLWSYECDHCGRRKQFVSQTSPVEDALAHFDERSVLGVR